MVVTVAEYEFDWETRMLAREGVMRVPCSEVQPNDLMIRVIEPNDPIPTGWTKLTEGSMWRRHMGGDLMLWPLPDFVLRDVRGFDA